MEHTFKDGKVPVICDLVAAAELKRSIDKEVEEEIKATEADFNKTRKIWKISLLVALSSLLLFFLFLDKSGLLTVLFLIICGVASAFFMFYTGGRKIHTSMGYNRAVEEIKNVKYPMAVHFLLLRDKVEILKSTLNYYKLNDETRGDLTLYWKDSDDIVQKKEFVGLKVIYKHGIIDTSVNLNKGCVIRPFVESTEF